MSKLYPCKASITESERIQIIGLLTLAKRHNESLKDIAKAVTEILGVIDPKNDGHCFDAVYGDYSTEELLEKMEVTVRGADNG